MNIQPFDASHVVIQPSKPANDLAVPVLGQRGNFGVVVDEDRTFRALIDRSAVLESVASEFPRQAGSKKSESNKRKARGDSTKYLYKGGEYAR